MKNYFSGNCNFALCESKTFSQSILMTDDVPTTLSMLRTSLGTTTSEINQFLHLELDAPNELVLLKDPYVVAEMRLVCLLGYSEAKKREKQETAA